MKQEPYCPCVKCHGTTDTFDDEPVIYCRLCHSVWNLPGIELIGYNRTDVRQKVYSSDNR